MPTKPSLKDPILELIRAKEHLNSLEVELRMFHTSKPTEVAIKVNPASGLNVLHVKLPMPPDRLGLIAGDVFFALRAALDHLMWQLCLFTTETPGKRTDFPCAWSFDPREGKRGTEALLHEAMKEIPPTAAVEVKALQPYHRGDTYKDDPLWQIDELCNIAKHMTIPLSHGMVEFKSNITEADVEEMAMPYLGEIIYVLTPEGSAKVQLHPEARSSVVFGSRNLGIEVTINEIRTLHEYVGNAVFPKFVRFFEPGGVPDVP
jgi:hypothetical protein